MVKCIENHDGDIIAISRSGEIQKNFGDVKQLKNFPFLIEDIRCNIDGTYDVSMSRNRRYGTQKYDKNFNLIDEGDMNNCCPSFDCRHRLDLDVNVRKSIYASILEMDENYDKMILLPNAMVAALRVDRFLDILI